MGPRGSEAKKFLLNLMKIFIFPGIKRSVYCDFVISEYKVNID